MLVKVWTQNLRRQAHVKWGERKTNQQVKWKHIIAVSPQKIKALANRTRQSGSAGGSLFSCRPRTGTVYVRRSVSNDAWASTLVPGPHCSQSAAHGGPAT
jgi:hypothetical protein